MLHDPTTAFGSHVLSVAPADQAARVRKGRCPRCTHALTEEQVARVQGEPPAQITCGGCGVTILPAAWDKLRRYAGKP
jgi:hypothetical protein